MPVENRLYLCSGREKLYRCRMEGKGSDLVEVRHDGVHGRAFKKKRPPSEYYIPDRREYMEIERANKV